MSGPGEAWAVTTLVIESANLKTLLMTDVVVSRKTVDCG